MGAIGSVREHDAAVVGRRSASSSRPSPYSSRARAGRRRCRGDHARRADADAGGDVRAGTEPRDRASAWDDADEISGGALEGDGFGTPAPGVPTRGPARRPRAT